MAKKTATKKTTKKKTTRKKKAAAKSRGLDAVELGGEPPAEVTAAADAVTGDGGAVLACYRDPLGGNWQLLAALPLDQLAPTPFQRDLSAAHVKRMAQVMDKLDRYLDPIVAVRSPADDGSYWTPNGGHRLEGMKQVGAKSITCLVVPFEVAYKILALNTEKAHSLGEKCLEVIRMARALSDSDGARPEADFELEFEDPAYVTLGCCYDQDKRFSGSGYTSVLGKIEAFLAEPLPAALKLREARAARLRALDKAVVAAAETLKKQGFVGSSLKGFVIKAINPLAAAKRGAKAEWDPTIEAMISAAEAFDPAAQDTSELPRV